jgi:hypothetical protein|eukprot:COSAG01_NODE_13070_length_1641_cov_1.622568_3_plen_103_part_00
MSDSDSDESSSSGSYEEPWEDTHDYGCAQYWEGYYEHHVAMAGTETEWYAGSAALPFSSLSWTHSRTDRQLCVSSAPARACPAVPRSHCESPEAWAGAPHDY